MLRRKLQGQVAIITGASRGIGAASARLLAEAGCALALTARDEDALDAISRELSSSGARAIPVPADISDPDMVEEVVESALAQFDRLDIVVNCAGSVWPLEQASETDVNEWAYGIHVNLVGPFYVVSNALPIYARPGVWADRQFSMPKSWRTEVGHERLFRVKSRPGRMDTCSGQRGRSHRCDHQLSSIPAQWIRICVARSWIWIWKTAESTSRHGCLTPNRRASSARQTWRKWYIGWLGRGAGSFRGKCSAAWTAHGVSRSNVIRALALRWTVR